MSYVFVNDSSQTNVPLLQACIDGDFNYSKRLLESGFDPNIRDSRGRTGLHLAAARGNVDICQLLHKFGADLLATDYQGNTALHLCGHVDTIQFLVSNGLKIDICNHQGATPLVLAKRRGVNKDVIRLLESLEEQEVKGFNRGTHSKLETMQTAESERSLLFSPRPSFQRRHELQAKPSGTPSCTSPKYRSHERRTSPVILLEPSSGEEGQVLNQKPGRPGTPAQICCPQSP